ncbi:uncharacterized protein LOC129757759 [Uranotaenia lowii]|uniref:uncharacterized protein LOC129757759 n=1 Tax=Uranotaenia lowii TaxID=190385 RepID=UPI00247AF796|nr:uncharacterized protein LOC129757759 [Uranotaenia lowii]
MNRKPVTSKINSGIPKTVSYIPDHRSNSLSRKSSQGSVDNIARSTSSASSVGKINNPNRNEPNSGKSATPGRRPRTGSVISTKAPSLPEEPSRTRRLGYRPAYLRNRKSEINAAVSRDPKIEDEKPPTLVPSEPKPLIERQRTFDKQVENMRDSISSTLKLVGLEVREQLCGGDRMNLNETRLLELALKDLLEEKRLQEAEIAWLKDESKSQLELGTKDRQRIAELEAFVDQIPQEMKRLCEEIDKRDKEIELLKKNQGEPDLPTRFVELQQDRNDLSRQVEKLLEEVDELRAENQTLRKKFASAQAENATQSDQDSEVELCEPQDSELVIQHLRRNISKSKTARTILKEQVQKLKEENRQLMDCLENDKRGDSLTSLQSSQNTDYSSLEEDTIPNQGTTEEDQTDASEVIDRFDFLEESRDQKRMKKRTIEVKKYEC